MGDSRGDTVHFDIVDQAGNMISATPSGGWLHSSPVIPELGFCLGTRAQMFWLEEGHPAALAPGKRPRTTLSPTLALRDGEPYLAWGSPGGDGQDQWITQMFLRHVHCGMNLQEAIDAPAWHSEHFPQLVLAAHRAPRRAGARRPRAAKDRSPNWSAAAISSRSDRTGRKAGSPPPRATGRAAAPPPTRAACRAMPPGGKVRVSLKRESAHLPRKREPVLGPRLARGRADNDRCNAKPRPCSGTLRLRCAASRWRFRPPRRQRARSAPSCASA